MAETRKHQNTATGMAAAVRAAIGEDVRPNEPGAQSAQPQPGDAPEPPQRGTWFLTSGAEAFLTPSPSEPSRAPTTRLGRGTST